MLHFAGIPLGEECTVGSCCRGASNSSNPLSPRTWTRAEAGSMVAMRIQRFSTSCFSEGLASIILTRRTGVVSTTKRMRTGSWMETICQGKPVRRSLAWPSMTPIRAVMLCGSLVPQP